jgi:predicted permease
VITAAASLVQDVRFAWRQLRRAPVFAVSASLTLALGIAVNAGVFSLLNALLRPLPVPDADQIVLIAAEFSSDDTGFRHQLSYPEIADYRTATAAFSDVFGFYTRITGMSVPGRSGKATQFVYHIVTGNFFSALRLDPAAGRFFSAGAGEHPGGEAVVVLGYGCWQRRFGGDPHIVGTIVRLDGQNVQVVGIAPRTFHGFTFGVDIDGYVPAGSLRNRSPQIDHLFEDRSLRVFTAGARLRLGVSLRMAQAATQVVSTRVQAQYPDLERGISARVLLERMARPEPGRSLADLLPLLYGSIFGLATLVLLLACMNIANLLLVRAAVRQREMALRVALGSGRTRVIRLLLAESALLALAGMAAGLVLARWATTMLEALFTPSFDVPVHLEFGYDWRVFAYASCVAIATAVITGIVPAIRASRADVSGLLHDGGYGASSRSGRQRLRSLLVIAQVAGSLVLLLIAGLCARNLQRARWIDPGFDPEQLVTVRLDPGQIGYDKARANAFYEDLERRLGALPGVESVSTSHVIPLGFLILGCSITPEHLANATTATNASGASGAEHTYGCNEVGPGYFETMRLPIVRGRAFSSFDREGADQVVIVNETLAKRLWPDAEPIGQRVVVTGSARPYRVIGVARDSKYIALFEHPLPFVYMALRQDPSFMRVAYVRSRVPPESLLPLVQHEIDALDPGIPIADLQTMRQMIDGSLGFLIFRMAAIQAAGMGLLGLVLAVVGVYGVVSYGASQRTREIGIRIALGAVPARVVWLVLGHGVRLVLAGLMVGLIAAILASRLMSTFFVLVAANDLPTFAVVTILLAATALTACYLPARRATRLDPIVTLRHE